MTASNTDATPVSAKRGPSTVACAVRHVDATWKYLNGTSNDVNGGVGGDLIVVAPLVIVLILTNVHLPLLQVHD